MRIIGCDLHARQQTLAMLDTETGEVVNRTLMHEGNEVREFYSELPQPVLVGIEAIGPMQWFLAGLCLVCSLFLVGCYAHGDRARVTTFDGSGTAIAYSTRTHVGTKVSFSGTLTVDVTSGTVTTMDVTLPGSSSFEDVTYSSHDNSQWPGWIINFANSSSDSGFLTFTTTAPGSLVGFTGGTISGGLVHNKSGFPLYQITGGSITARTDAVRHS